MCYNSIRTRNVIAHPTPIRYADLCAYRSKLHIEAQNELINIPKEKESQFEEMVIRQLNTLVKIDEKIKNRLYYC